MARPWLTNRVANPVLRRVLRTRLGRRLGRGLALLRYTGRRTGEPHEVVCGYARDGDAVWILVGQAGRKTWWHNFRAEAPVEVWLAGERRHGRAVAVEGAVQPEQAAAGLATYLRSVPAARRSLGLADDGTGRTAAERVTLVRVRLT